MLDELSKSLTPRLLFLLLITSLVLIASTGYSMWFKNQIKDYRQLQTRYNTMKDQPSDLKSAEAIAKNLRQEISDLNNQLTSVGHEVLKGTKPLSVISDLGKYAKQHGVQMVSIKPEKGVRGKLYTETPFSVDLSGSYVDLFKWVYSLEHSNSPLLIKKISMSPGSISPEPGKTNRIMQLTVGLIQLIEEG